MLALVQNSSQDINTFNETQFAKVLAKATLVRAASNKTKAANQSVNNLWALLNATSKSCNTTISKDVLSA